MNTRKSRRRGGQPGNNNARKHGFYASHLPQSDRRALATSKFSGLTEEIALMRASIRRIVSLTPPPDDFYANLDWLRTLCLATTALTRMVRTDAQLGTDDSEFAQARDIALRELAKELGFDRSDADRSSLADDDPLSQNEPADSLSSSEDLSYPTISAPFG